MWSNQPQTKICFKSDWNLLLINFFDLISAVRFARHDDSIQIRTINRLSNSIYIKNNQNRSILIDLFDINWLFQSFKRLFWSFNWNPLLDFESDRSRQSKSTGLESELSTIQIVSPNRISLVKREENMCNFFPYAFILKKAST